MVSPEGVEAHPLGHVPHSDALILTETKGRIGNAKQTLEVPILLLAQHNFAHSETAHLLERMSSCLGWNITQDTLL